MSFNYIIVHITEKHGTVYIYIYNSTQTIRYLIVHYIKHWNSRRIRQISHVISNTALQLCFEQACHALDLWQFKRTDVPQHYIDYIIKIQVHGHCWIGIRWLVHPKSVKTTKLRSFSLPIFFLQAHSRWPSKSSSKTPPAQLAISTTKHLPILNVVKPMSTLIWIFTTDDLHYGFNVYIYIYIYIMIHISYLLFSLVHFRQQKEPVGTKKTLVDPFQGTVSSKTWVRLSGVTASSSSPWRWPAIFPTFTLLLKAK